MYDIQVVTVKPQLGTPTLDVQVGRSERGNDRDGFKLGWCELVC